jgi:molecular chaperone DnaK
MIQANTTIPTRKTQIFTTAADNQTAVTIHVLQGEREMAADNRTLGRFDLMDIPPAPRGVPQIEVSFDIDANGIVQVKAVDKATNKEQSIKITASSGLAEDEIQKMVNEAKEHETEDKKKRELIETRNQADTLIYSIEKSLKEFGDKVDESERKSIETATESLKKAIGGDDLDAIKKEMEELQKASHKLAEEMYKKAGPAPGAEQGAAPNQEKPKEEKKDEGPIEAEYEVVDEEEEKKDKKKKK